MKGIFYTVVVLLLMGETMPALEPWTYLVKKQFGIDGHPLCCDGSVFKKEGIAPFSQLIFSWNGIRPREGSLLFYSRIRFAKTGQWGDWHKMFEWGALTQRSFGDQGTKDRYCHVRLEILNGFLADGFEIKVESIDGADSQAILLMAVCLSRFDKFEGEKDLDRYALCEKVLIKGIPFISQMEVAHPDYSRICSPTSLCMLTSFLTGEEQDPVLFAQGVFDEGLAIFGSWPFNVAYAYEQIGGNCQLVVQRLYSFATLYNLLNEGRPVVVSVRGYIESAPKPYPSGHLLLVVGFDPIKNLVFCCDPAAPEDATVFRGYPLESFVRAWENSHRLAYVVA